MTKKDKILRHLQQNGSITSLEAIMLYGCTRLSARIYDLKNEGHMFIKDKICIVDRYGNKVKYTKYNYIGQIERCQEDLML